MPSAKYLRIFIFGDERVHRQLLRGAAVAVNPKVAFNVIASDLMNVIGANFESQGRRGGGSWKFLQPDTIRRKLAKGQDPRILIATGALMRSMTERGDINQNLQVTSKTIRLSSELPYAEAHDQGIGQPKRQFTRILPTDRARWASYVTQEIRDAILGV